jgi:DNA-directed RNA polymerase specialized sigma24 family protein
MDDAAHDLIVSTIAEHADALLRTARRHTCCAEDAEDAYQRALETFVRCAHRLEPATAHRWLHKVVKHEAFAVAEARSRLVGIEDEAVMDALADGREVPATEERVERFEELARAAEALGRLKPQEVTALWLKAQGVLRQPDSESHQLQLAGSGRARWHASVALDDAHFGDRLRTRPGLTRTVAGHRAVPPGL